jgi:hypothetical protein
MKGIAIALWVAVYMLLTEANAAATQRGAVITVGVIIGACYCAAAAVGDMRRERRYR